MHTLKAVHDRLRAAQPLTAGPQELLPVPDTAPIAPAVLADFVTPNSEGIRLIVLSLQLGHSAGSGLCAERSHASNLCPHSSHLYS
jgi:hypothetical protein